MIIGVDPHKSTDTATAVRAATEHHGAVAARRCDRGWLSAAAVLSAAVPKARLGDRGCRRAGVPSGAMALVCPEFGAVQIAEPRARRSKGGHRGEDVSSGFRRAARTTRDSPVQNIFGEPV